LKRCNRSRGFSIIFARHKNFHGNYRIFQGPICKKLKQPPMVTSGYCSSNSRRFRAREVAGSRGNERGRREDSIPYLTTGMHRRDRISRRKSRRQVCSSILGDSVRAAYRGWERGCRAGRCRGEKCRAHRGLGTWGRYRGGGTAPWWPVALLAMRTGAGGAHEAQAGAAGAHEELQGEAPGHARQQEWEGGAGGPRAHGQGEGLARLVQQLLLAAPRGKGGLGCAWRRRRTGQKDAMAALHRKRRSNIAGLRTTILGRFYRGAGARV
jgi:hypothetical protein